MKLYLLIFSLFSIIGSLQGSEPYDSNSDGFDFGTNWLILASDRNQDNSSELEKIADQSLEDWCDFGDEMETPVDTSEKREQGRPGKKAERNDGNKNRKRKREAHCEDSDTSIKKEARRHYDDDYKIEMAELCVKNKSEGTSIAEFCRQHDIPSSTLRDWIKNNNKKKKKRTY
jgi:hypothetical protein